MVRYALQLRLMWCRRLPHIKALGGSTADDRSIRIEVDIDDLSSTDADEFGFVAAFATSATQLKKSASTEWPATLSMAVEWDGATERRMRFRVMLAGATESGEGHRREIGRVHAEVADIVRSSKQTRASDGGLRWFFDAPVVAVADAAVAALPQSMVRGYQANAARLHVKAVVVERMHHYEVRAADRYVLSRWAPNLLRGHGAGLVAAEQAQSELGHRPSSLIDEMFSSAKADMGYIGGVTASASRRAAYSYIADALAGHSARHRSGVLSVRIRFAWTYSTPVKWIRRLVLLMQLGLVMIEAPTFASWEAPLPVAALIEAVLLIFHFADSMLHIATDRRGCCTRSWNSMRMFICVAMIIDIVASLTLYWGAGVSYVRPTRVLRVALAFFGSVRILHIVESIFSTFRKLVSPLSLSLAFTALYAFVGMHLFTQETAPGRMEFATFGAAFRHLIWSMWGSVNFPDTMLPAYLTQSRAVFFFYGSFLTMQVFVFINLMTAVVYTHFQGEAGADVFDAYVTKRIALVLGFKLLALSEGVESREQLAQRKMRTVNEQNDEEDTAAAEAAPSASVAAVKRLKSTTEVATVEVAAPGVAAVGAAIETFETPVAAVKERKPTVLETWYAKGLIRRARILPSPAGVKRDTVDGRGRSPVRARSAIVLQSAWTAFQERRFSATMQQDGAQAVTIDKDTFSRMVRVMRDRSFLPRNGGGTVLQIEPCCCCGSKRRSTGDSSDAAVADLWAVSAGANGRIGALEFISLLSKLEEKWRPAQLVQVGVDAPCPQRCCSGGVARWLRPLITHSIFTWTIDMLVAANVLLMLAKVNLGHAATDDPCAAMSSTDLGIAIAEGAFSAIFGLEAVAKILAIGCAAYATTPTHIFDGATVVLSTSSQVAMLAVRGAVEYVDDGKCIPGVLLSTLRVATALRSIRLVRFFLHLRTMRRIIRVVLHVVVPLSQYLAALLLLMYAFTMVGQSLYSGPNGLVVTNERLAETDWARAGFEVKCREVYTVFETWPAVLQDAIGPALHVKAVREAACGADSQATSVQSYANALNFESFADGFMTMTHLLIQVRPIRRNGRPCTDLSSLLGFGSSDIRRRLQLFMRSQCHFLLCTSLPLTQNNWHVTMTAALALDDGFFSQLAAHLFFFGNFVVMVIVFSNVVVSFIVDSYMFVVEQGEITPTKLDESLKGTWANARRAQAANAGGGNPIALAVHRIMAGSSVMRNTSRKADYSVGDRVQVFRFGHQWRDAKVSELMFAPGAWVTQGRSRTYRVVLDYVQTRGGRLQQTSTVRSRDTILLVAHDCMREPIYSARTTHHVMLRPVRILCGDDAVSGCGCLMPPELQHPQCVQCNEEFGARRVLCPSSNARRCANKVAQHALCRILEMVFGTCLSSVARADQVYCVECTRVGAVLPVCQSCAPLRIAPTWQQYRRHDAEGKVGGEWVDAERSWLPRRICAECWEQRQQLELPDSRNGTLRLQTRIVQRRGFDFFQRSLYSTGAGVDLDEIEERAETGAATSSTTWRSEGSATSNAKQSADLVAKALAKMGLESHCNRVIKTEKVTTLNRLASLTPQDLVAFSFDRNERKRFESWRQQRAAKSGGT